MEIRTQTDDQTVLFMGLKCLKSLLVEFVAQMKIANGQESAHDALSRRCRVDGQHDMAGATLINLKKLYRDVWDVECTDKREGRKN